MSLDIPDGCADKAVGFPEYSYGVNRVTLVLKDGRRIARVLVAWGGEIVEVDGAHIEEEKELGFNLVDIIDVEPCP